MVKIKPISLSMEDKMELMMNHKKFDFKRGDDEALKIEKIPTGIPNLDTLIGGGIPKKALTELVGESGSGKSYMAGQIAKKVLERGGVGAWVDTEFAVNPGWMEKCGVPMDKIGVLQPYNGEEAIDATRECLQAGMDIVVLDSLAGLMPKDNLENDASYTPMAWQSRFLNQSIPKLINDLRYGSILILVNQLRGDLGANKYEVNLNVPGGKAQVFFAHIFLELRRGAWIKDKDDTKLGFDMGIRMRKGRFSEEQWGKTSIPFKVAGGVDLIETFMREGLAKGKIKQAGAWYTYRGEKVMGSQGLHDLLESTPTLFQQLEEDIGENDT